MSFALSAGVTGLQAHQKMLDVAGNNLANINTTAFKASRITFSELLSETIKKASQPTATTGGTNPQQMGSGVGVSGIAPNMSQGNIVNTGNPLDMAIEGEGYFVLSDGQQNVFTRAGAFAVDADSSLVDPASGYRIQRIGSDGESEGFQTAGNSDIHVPYDVSMPANATSQVVVTGNLSADAMLSEPQTNMIASNITYTSAGTAAGETTRIADLDQYSGTLTSGIITFSGYKPDGTSLASASPSVDLTMPVDSTTTLGDILTWLNTNEGTPAVDEVQTISITGLPTGGTFTLTFNGETTSALDFDASAAEIQSALEALSTIGASNVACAGGDLPGTPVTVTFQGSLAGTDVALISIDDSGLTGGTTPTGSVAETTKGRAVQGVLGGDTTASLVNGQIRITDASSGYSKTDLTMSYAGDGTLEVPAYFEISTVGGQEVKSVNITVYDSQGGKHVLSGAFVRTDTSNMWDMVLTSITGNVHEIAMDNRRITGITFSASDGSYSGLGGATPDSPEFVVTFENNTASPQTMSISLGTVGKLDGLTQYSGNSTAVAREQNGYEAGTLSTVSVDNEGKLIGAFSNGIKKTIASIQIALFQNPAALENIGNGYFTSSANSGTAVATYALTGGAGRIHGGALEKSNADVATEFVNMIQAQNGFQANARTIRVANDILRELTNIIS
jgi:flagellar hook protein FlgE